MTDNEIIKAFEWCTKADCVNCPHIYLNCRFDMARKILELINRQKAEIERLKDEASKARRKALLEAKGKFAGHSDYHGDTILCELICMAEGKEVGNAKPLDKSEIKAEAIKEFAKRLKQYLLLNRRGEMSVVSFENIDYLVKEMVGEQGEVIRDNCEEIRHTESQNE